MTGDALKEIVKELRDVEKDRPLTEDEVTVARSAEMSVFPQSFETPSSIASALAQLAIYQLPDDYLRQYPGQLQSVETGQAAQAMAQVAERQQIRILVVGDRKIVQPELKKAGFDKIKYLDTDGRKIESKPTLD